MEVGLALALRSLIIQDDIMAKLLLEDWGDPEKIKAHRETKRFISGCQRLGREFGGWCCASSGHTEHLER